LELTQKVYSIVFVSEKEEMVIAIKNTKDAPIESRTLDCITK
jgi:hypothetical protein